MKYTFVEDGEANFYTIPCENRWYARVQLNGELFTLAQCSIMTIMVEVLNG